MNQTLIRSILKIGAGILVAKGFADDSTAEIIVAGLTALIAVLWGIFHRTPPPTGTAPVTDLPSVAAFFGLAATLFLLTGCGSTGHVGTAYDPASGALSGSAGVSNNAVDVTASGGYNLATGQPLPITVTVSFKDSPSAAVQSILADAGAVTLSSRSSTVTADSTGGAGPPSPPVAYQLTVPDVLKPDSLQFAALRAALADGAVIRGP